MGGDRLIFVKIYITFSLATFALFIFELKSVTQRLKCKYDIPDNPNKNMFSQIPIILKVFIACFVPLMNATFFYLLMFKNEVLEEVWEQCVVLSLKKKEEEL